jgi:hypothetical protein
MLCKQIPAADHNEIDHPRGENDAQCFGLASTCNSGSLWIDSLAERTDSCSSGLTIEV